MGRSRRGSGSVFQRTYRDAKGKNRKTKNWYIEFVAGNRTIREATDFTNRTDAAEFLKKRMSDALGGKIVLSRNVTYDDLRDLIITDYTNNGRKSLGDLKTTRLPRLDAVFGGTKAIDITTTSVERYKTLRLKEKAAPATVNRELAALKRMFRLGLRQGMVGDDAVHLDARRAQRAQGLLRAGSVPGHPEASADRISRAVRDRLHHRLADEVGAADTPVAARRFRRQGLAADRCRRGEGRDRRP